MLSDMSRPVVQATLPVIGERLGEITKKFYAGMFEARPELLDGMFSRANQKNGAQQQALAGSIVAFANHLIEYPESLPESVLARIAHKHTSLGIKPEQYQIVFDYLFAAIAEDLGEAATEEVVAAWSEVYWLMADALVKIEKGLYAEQANDRIYAPWKLTSKEASGLECMTFRFEPADETGVSVAKPGQFVSIRLPLADGLRQCRQYSLSDNVESTTERVLTTKLDAGGEVSPFMHLNLEVGDVVELSNPYGDITLDMDGGPIIIATAGIGCTPSASALQSLVASGSDRQVLVLHAEAMESNWALKDQMLSAVEQLPNVEMRLWLKDTTTISEGLQAAEGYMNLSGVELPADARMYLCGPLPFMRAVRSQAIAAGVVPTNIHYEVFGPDLWLAA